MTFLITSMSIKYLYTYLQVKRLPTADKEPVLHSYVGKKCIYGIIFHKKHVVI